MKVRNLETLVNQLKPHLREYLEQIGTEFSRTHFQCPNRKVHKNNDSKPAAAFAPDDDTRWKCFACEESGDILTAMSLFENKEMGGQSFVDIVMSLADRFKIIYETEELSPEEKKQERLRSILTTANTIIHGVLKNENAELAPIKKYIADRGWNRVFDTFEFGYCKYEKLIDLLRTKFGYPDQELRESGVTSAVALDRRLIYPIKDYHGRVVAFGSRLIPGVSPESDNRYATTTTTELFRKMDTLYNLYNVKGQEKVYLVEGNADVWTMASYGVFNAVAMMGTAFTESHYKSLVRAGVKQLVICPDLDDVGMNCLHQILETTCKVQRGLDILIKLPLSPETPVKDVDEFLQKYKRDAFDALPEVSSFDYQLVRCANSPNDSTMREKLLDYILTNPSFIERDQMAKKMAKALKVREETILNELERIATTKGVEYQISSVEVLQEKRTFETDVDDLERRAWSRNGMLGLVTGFPIFDQKLEGLQDAYHIIAGETNIGKSAILMSLAYGVLLNNPGKVFVLYLSIDDNLSKTIPRFEALHGGLPIRLIKNPVEHIVNNDKISDAEKADLLTKRYMAVSAFGSPLGPLPGKSTLSSVVSPKAGQGQEVINFKDCLAVKDDGTVQNLEQVKRLVQLYKEIAGKDRKLVLFIDNLHKLTVPGEKDIRAMYVRLSKELKGIIDDNQIPLVTTAELRKLNSPGARPTLDDIKETGSFAFDADVIMMIYNELAARGQSDLYFDEEIAPGKKKVYPIVEFIFGKNKVEEFKGVLYYKFYTDKSKVVECSDLEMRMYREMVLNPKGKS